jgi:hypothetical protein
VKKEQSCSSATRMCIHCRDRDDFTFTFTSVGLNSSALCNLFLVTKLAEPASC